jgi:hypothetical protein
MAMRSHDSGIRARETNDTPRARARVCVYVCSVAISEEMRVCFTEFFSCLHLLKSSKLSDIKGILCHPFVISVGTTKTFKNQQFIPHFKCDCKIN